MLCPNIDKKIRKTLREYFDENWQYFWKPKRYSSNPLRIRNTLKQGQTDGRMDLNLCEAPCQKLSISLKSYFLGCWNELKLWIKVKICRVRGSFLTASKEIESLILESRFLKLPSAWLKLLKVKYLAVSINEP